MASVESNVVVTPVTPTIGAVVSGIDLSHPLGNANFVAVQDALLRHQVLFFEQQNLTPRQHRDFAAAFGDLHIHPIYPHVADQPEIIVLDNHADNPTDNDNWHTDVTFIETPPLGSILLARELPPHGGDTLWSNMAAAFAALSTPLQALLTGLSAVHDFAKSFPAEEYAAKVGEEGWQRARAKNPPVVHPVVRTHPATGVKGLFVNEGFTTRILGLTARESDALLRFLFEHIARPEFTCRWRWKPNSVAFWDNRVTQHFAVNDYLPHRRVMHRATILGDRPA
jgi:taurine dioxygenase